jgi:2-dehydropantoate 2-reductase
LKIAIMGSGGVGGYFGGRLAQAGHDVSFIARGAHLNAIKEQGLRITSSLGDAHLPGVRASADPAEIGEVDVVLFAVKLYDTRDAAHLVAPMVGSRTTVVSLPNGIDSEAILREVLGPAPVVGGVARISASISEPGVIAQHGSFASLEFGELDGSDSERLRRLAEACVEAGIKARVSNSIVTAIWRKFVFLASFSAITGLTRLPLGPIRGCAASFELYQRAVREALAVADAAGAGLGADEFDTVMAGTEAMGDGIKASMLVDIERGRPIEVEWLSGAVARVGREHGVDTPVHDTVLAALSPLIGGDPLA